MRVYLDNCCYNRPYDDQSQMRIHLEAEDSFDYTIWRKEYFKNRNLDEIREEAAAYEKTHPFKGKAARL